MKLFFVTLCVFFCFIDYGFCGFEIVDFGKSQGGSIKIVCESKTIVSIENNRKYAVADGFDGLFIRNVPSGVYVVSTVQPGFSPESWPIEVQNGKISEIIVTKSSPSSSDKVVEERLKQSHNFSESRKSLIEVNEILKKYRHENNYFYADNLRTKGGEKTYYGNNKLPDNNMDYEEYTAFSVVVYDDSGREHGVEIRIVSEGYAYDYRETSWSDPDCVRNYSCTYKLYFDNNLVDSFKYVDIDRSGGFDGLYSAKNDGWSKKYDIYPVSITLARLKKSHGTNDVATNSGLSVDIKSMF